MQFIRDNMFLVILAGVVVVVGGILLLVNATLAGSVDDAIAKRITLAGDLSRLGTGMLVNEQAVRQEEERIRAVQRVAKIVSDLTIDWNRANYEVMRLRLGDGQEIAAFPIDPNLYEQHTLVWDFTKEYLRRLERLSASLRPTFRPTKEEKQAAIAREQARIDREALLLKGKEAQNDRFDSTRPQLSVGVEPGRRDIAGSSEARQRGIDAIRVAKAMEGAIYVDPGAMDPVFLEPQPKAEEAKLWQAQLNLWITADILAAINKTNRQALARPDGTSVPPVVPNSAVKRLVKIDIDENYLGVKDRTDTGQVKPSRPISPLGYPQPQPGLSGKVAPPMGMLGSTGYGLPAAGRAALTGRTTTKAHDVINYSFTVVMPTRKVMALIRNLAQRGNNTVLSLKEVAPSPTESIDYYYGTDAVMEVTIWAEALFLPGWHRQLMPKEVLKRLPADALRPEDTKRISSADKRRQARGPSGRTDSRRRRRRR